MTLLPMYRICPKCKRRYAWNPDVGKMSCPRCSAGHIKMIRDFVEFFKSRNKSQ